VVRSLAVVVAVLACLLATACGDDDDGSAVPTAPLRATAAPTQAPEGVQAQVEPRHGPPGIQITVSGSGWPANVALQVTGFSGRRPDPAAEPYESTMTNADGTFSVTFRLEKKPDGSDLETGGFTLVVQTAEQSAEVPFLIESRRPIQNQGPS
jgi:hypothetical protein